jgi:hypothetical protein
MDEVPKYDVTDVFNTIVVWIIGISFFSEFFACLREKGGCGRSDLVIFAVCSLGWLAPAYLGGRLLRNL